MLWSILQIWIFTGTTNLLIALVHLNNLLTVSSLLFPNRVQRISYEMVLNIGIRACNNGIVRCEATSLNVLQPRHCGHSRNKLSIDWPLPRCVNHNPTTRRVQNRQATILLLFMDYYLWYHVLKVSSTARLCLILVPSPPSPQSTNNPNIDMNIYCRPILQAS